MVTCKWDGWERWSVRGTELRIVNSEEGWRRRKISVFPRVLWMKEEGGGGEIGR